MAKTQTRAQVAPNNVVQLHTTGSISPPPLAPVPALTTAHIIPALGLMAISGICAAIGTWMLVDSWYGGPAHRDLMGQVEAVNNQSISIHGQLNQAKEAICK
jgi:hypothetical protein